MMAYRDPTNQLASYFRDQKRLRNPNVGQTDALTKTFHSVQEIGPIHAGLIAKEKFKAFTCEFFMSSRCLLHVVKGEAAKFHDNRH